MKEEMNSCPVTKKENAKQNSPDKNISHADVRETDKEFFSGHRYTNVNDAIQEVHEESSIKSNKSKQSKSSKISRKSSKKSRKPK